MYSTGMPQDQAQETSLPPPFFEWVAEKRAGENPRGDFIRDTRSLLQQGYSETGIRGELARACQEARSEYQKLESLYRRQFGTAPSDSGYRHQRESAVGLSWSNIRWRVLPYVVYICRNGNIVLGNRRYLPLWVWEREPGARVGSPDWTPVNERAFVKGIVMSLHTYRDGSSGLPRDRMIAHVNAKLEDFRLGGLPQNWESHRQATDRQAWDFCRAPSDEDGHGCRGAILDFS